MKTAIAEILLKKVSSKHMTSKEEGSFSTIVITLKYGTDKNEKSLQDLENL